MAFMQQGHERQLLLCDALETIADCLPDNVSLDLTTCALTLLRSGALEDARAQEQALFQALGQHTASTRHLRFVIDRLAADHADDCCAALEIAGALRELAEHGSVSNPDMLGFMLRGYFDAQRRHIEWEARVFLPLVSELLTSDELVDLQQNAAICPTTSPAALKIDAKSEGRRDRCIPTRSASTRPLFPATQAIPRRRTFRRT